MKTLGGSTFAFNAIKQDYHIIETLNCLYELCDEVSVVVGGDDGTIELVSDWYESKIYNIGKIVRMECISMEEWHAQQGREKLSYFSNLAIRKLSTDYNIYVQADEVIHEDSFSYIRSAIEQPHSSEAFLCSRINLWASPYTMLNVTIDRVPVSPCIIRLAKTKYRCVGDAESLGGMGDVETDYLKDIRIYHTGFVRDKYKHIEKIKHMQSEVFLMDYDKRVHDCEDGFDPWKFGFTPKDVIPIRESLPKFVTQWAKERTQPAFRSTSHGYLMAMEFLNNCDENVTGEFSSDRWSIVQLANDVWNRWNLNPNIVYPIK